MNLQHWVPISSYLTALFLFFSVVTFLHGGIEMFYSTLFLKVF